MLLICLIWFGLILGFDLVPFVCVLGNCLDMSLWLIIVLYLSHYDRLKSLLLLVYLLSFGLIVCYLLFIALLV